MYFFLSSILPSLWLAPADTHRSATLLEFAYTVDFFSSLSGTRPQWAWMDKVDVMLTLRLNAQTSVFLYGLGNQGKAFSESLGIAQTLSNIEAPTSWRLYEAFIEYVTAAERFSILAGLYDLSSEFDALSTARLFLNSSFGTGPELAQSRPQGPSIFPVTSLGMRLRALLTPFAYSQLALLDGVPGDPSHPAGTHVRFDANDGLLLVAEVGLSPKLQSHSVLRPWQASRLAEADEVPKIALGAWYYTARFERHKAGWQRGNAGVYLLGEVLLIENESRALWGFIRLGVADPRVNRFAYYTGGGLSAKGWIAGRAQDRLGIGLAAVHHSPFYTHSDGRARTTEWVIEGTYLWQITPNFYFQFDLQGVHQPNTLPDSILVGGVRLHWTL
jgi:porin